MTVAQTLKNVSFEELRLLEAKFGSPKLYCQMSGA